MQSASGARHSSQTRGRIKPRWGHGVNRRLTAGPAQGSWPQAGSGTGPSMSSDPTDSIYSFTFRANTGDSWGGWLVEDTGRHAVGQTIVSSFGRYEITAREDRGADLSGFGLNEGMVFVAWYYDAVSAQFLPTRTGAGTASGLAGLGSEADAAWTGTSWVGFGLGGQMQVDAPPTPEAWFTWQLVTSGGDTISGALRANGADYDVGDTILGRAGVYTILTEAPLAGGDTTPSGTVRMTRYQDAASELDLQLQSGGAATVGTAGLGSELDRAWNGNAWVQVGRGGELQVDRQIGYSVGHAPRWDAGDGWSTPHGRYVIWSEQPWSVPAGQDRWSYTYAYFDGQSGNWLSTYFWGALGGRPNSTAGMGQEVDYAWDGDSWDMFAIGGLHQADVEMQNLYTYAFVSPGGDMWVGWVLEDSRSYALNQRIAAANGEYVIVGSARWDFGGANGTVWTTSYYDGQSGQWLPTYHWSQFGSAAAQGGLGSEFDYAWDGAGWDDFGCGGHFLSDLGGDSLYLWLFTADTGDVYGGWLFEDSARFAAGSSWRGALGTYLINGEFEYGGDSGLHDGTTYVTFYYDGRSGQYLPVLGWSQGAPATIWGLGTEYDQALTSRGWAHFGIGGIHQLDFA